MNFLFYTISSLILINLQLIDSRKVSSDVNKGCSECAKGSSPTNLVHITSSGDNETIHFLWFTIKNSPPSVLIVQTSLETTLNVDWNKLINETDVSGAINFNPQPINAIGIEISKIYFFDDDDKKGTFQPNYKSVQIEWNQTQWEGLTEENVTTNGDSRKVTFIQKKGNEFYNGTIEFTAYMNGDDGRDDTLPHLAFTHQSTLIQINVLNVLLNQLNYTRPRLMTDLTIVTYANGMTQQKINRISSIDDEYTPGVFDRLNLKLESGRNDPSQSAFAEWRPVSYFKSERIIANTLDVVDGDVESLESLSVNSRALNAFFDKSQYNVTKFNLTFGAVDDTKNYYTDDNKYNSFSLVTGLGPSPDQKLSFLVQMIILVGFGLPLLVMVISALYLIIRKIRKRKYDDLLLNQESNEQSR